MTEWWTYRLHSFLMFSPRTYWRTVENYNAEVWPMQAVAVLAAAAVLVLALRRKAPRVVAGILALAWAWVGWAFLWQRYSPIFLAGPWLAGASGLQALALAGTAVRGLPAAAVPRWQMHAGLVLVVLGLLLVPALTGFGHMSRVHLFATMPDPTALATLGLVVSGALPGQGRASWALAALPAITLVAGALTWWALLA